MKKRDFLRCCAAVLPAGSVLATTDVSALSALPALLKAGGCVLMFRHAQTEPGVGDPPNFNLSQCSTQRNLSEAGRAQAQRIGQWFKTQNLQPRSVQTSAWCRCKDTASLAFGDYTELTALNSTFESRTRQDAQTKTLRRRLGLIPANQFEVWVTHQVNITSLTGDYTSMGEALLVNNKGQVVVRTSFLN